MTNQQKFLLKNLLTLKDEIKSYIVKKGYTVSSLAELLTQKGYPTSKQNLNNKITNETIKHKEILKIAEVLGYKIEWIEK